MRAWLVIALGLVCWINIAEGQKISYKEISREKPQAVRMISNDTDHEIDISSLLNQLFFLSKDSLIQFIRKMDVPKALDKDYQRAWLFMGTYTWSQRKPLAGARDIKDGLTFFNAIGSGFCGNKSQALAWIWRAMGYDTRVVDLEGHVVPEIFVKNHWEVWDPTYHIYYTDDYGTPLSVDSLAAHSKYVNHPNICPGLRKNIWSRFMGNSRNLAKIYESVDNNRIIENTLIDLPSDTSLTIKLPPKSKLIFPVFSRFPLWSDFKGDFTQLYNYAECAVFIDSGYVGFIEFPFILHAIESKEAMIVINDKRLPLNDRWPAHTFPGIRGGSRLRIAQNQKGIWLYFLINPQLLQRNPDLIFPNNINGINVTSVRLSPRNRINVIVGSDILHGVHLNKLQKAFFRWISTKK